MKEKEIASNILKNLQDAWNKGDGNAFGESFVDNATFVDIRGDYHRGRTIIAKGHQAIFDTIYKGSVVSYEIVDCFPLDENVLIAISSATLKCPTGPLAGENKATQTIILTNKKDNWLILAFHNTLVMKDKTN